MVRKYTKEFKIQACELVIKEGLNPKVVGKQFGLNPIMLYRWIDEYKTYGDQAFMGSGYLKPEDAKIKKLERELAELKQENEILKKAAAYFAKHNE